LLRLLLLLLKILASILIEIVQVLLLVLIPFLISHILDKQGNITILLFAVGANAGVQMIGHKIPMVALLTYPLITL
jgi:hypothetical protein